MKHIIILDDKNKQSKALLEIAKVLKEVKILTEGEWEATKDKFPEKKKRKLGLGKGKIKMMPNFDDPLEEFKEYM